MAEGTMTSAGKGRRLEGGAVSEEAIASSRSVLGHGPHGQMAGLEQWYCPPQVGELCKALWGEPTTVFDPTAGDGSLLGWVEPDAAFGVEVDPDQAEAGEGRYTALTGDVQRLYPLLRAVGVRFPLVVANPPWGLRWRVGALHGGKEASSTLLGWKIALGLLDERGQGLLITGAERFGREIADDEDAGLVWATVEVPDLFDGVELSAMLAFFSGPEGRGEGAAMALECSRAELAEVAGELRGVCPNGGALPYSAHRYGVRAAFEQVAGEHAARLEAEARGRPRYDVSLRGRRLHVKPSGFAQLAVREADGYTAMRSLERFHGKALSYIGLNLRDWRRLSRWAAEGLVTMAPELEGAAEEALEEIERELCPLYRVRPQQRLGFLEDLDRIACVRSAPKHGFSAGESYPISTNSKVLRSEEQRPYEKRDGSAEVRTFVKERKLLEVRIGDETFDESAEAIEFVLEHFDVPDPGELADRYPAEVARAQRILDELTVRHGWAEKDLAWKSRTLPDGTTEVWQREDLARLVVKGSGGLDWQQGAGKTVGQIALALACFEYWPKCRRQALVVVPQDLVPQWQGQARKFFDFEFEVIDSLPKARRVAKAMRAGEEGMFITWYELLSLTGSRRELLAPVTIEAKREYRDEFGRTRSRYVTLTSEEACPTCHTLADMGWDGETCAECGHVHRALEVRPAASVLSTAFRHGVVCIDERSEMRGMDSRRSKAMRALRGAHRFGGTGTAISNYVNDAFWGLWWCLGNATTRFPYDYAGGPSQFAADFCVMETLMGSEERGEGHRKQRVKVLPEVTNVSALWRLLSSAIVRRRTEDMGDVVPRADRPIEVPMGRVQQQLHKGWLEHFEAFFCERNPNHPLVEAGAVERFAEVLGRLAKLEYASTLPPADPDCQWVLNQAEPPAIASYWTPALLKVLELVLAHVRGGEKVLVGSELVETGYFISQRLRERGVNAVHIVEEDREGKHRTKNPRKRAAEVAAFTSGEAQVLCAGARALKLGHSLDTASVAILLGFPWSFMATDQFVKRVHRLTSERPVSAYYVYPKGSLGERKHQLVVDKGAASDLALDGQLIDEPEKPIDWRKVVKELRAAGASLASEDTVEEAEVEALWNRAEGPYAPLAAALEPQETRELDPLGAGAIDGAEQLDLFAGLAQ